MISKTETKKTLIQLMKYGVIGVMNTLITAISFYLLNTWAGVPYGAANIIGYVLGVINSFIWNRQWVFKTGSNIKREALLFGCGFFICWILQGAVSLFLLEGLDSLVGHHEGAVLAVHADADELRAAGKFAHV